MIETRVVERAGFRVVGRQVYISGPDNAQFGRFWEQCKADGSLERLYRLRDAWYRSEGAQTGAAVLGVSRVEADPGRRDFYYLIGVEIPVGGELPEDLEACEAPAGRWAVFGCRGPMPDALVEAEIYAFTRWLPNSGYQHAGAPEMEVYPPGDEAYREFWLPIVEVGEAVSWKG